MLNGRRKVALNLLKGLIQIHDNLCAYDVYFVLLLFDPFTPSPPPLPVMESERNYGDNGLNPMSNQF
jgi:hypothetical protein